MSPDMPSSGKKLYLTGPYSSHLCRTRVSAVFLFQHRTADHHGEPALHVDGPSLWVRDPGEQDNSASFATRQDEQTELTGHTLTVDLYWSLAVCLTRERRRSVVVYVDKSRKREGVPKNKLDDTFNATARPHSGPWLTYLRSKNNQGTQLAIIKILSTAIARNLRRRAERGNPSSKRGV